MDSQKLVALMKNESGTIKGFADKIGVAYTTIFQATQSDEKLQRMSVTMFINVANGLNMTADELVKELVKSA